MLSEESGSRQQSSRRALQAGEWACVDSRCANINSERHTTCKVCGKGSFYMKFQFESFLAKPRPKSKSAAELGKDAAEKSKGLFSANDWACTKCGNVNWARRNVCNVCNAKRFGDTEERTGFGGGFNDRQNVEYIERRDIDEYDEFGRRKRKK
jgi:RNA polymerase subunit RPABC4/transcription elongation factor Spt4